MLDKNPNPDTDLSEDRRSVKERMIEALSRVREGITELTSLEDLDTATFSIMDTLPESVELAEEIAAARREGNRAKEAILIDRQRRIYQDIQGELALIAGIETDQTRVERENNEYRRKMTELVGDIDPEERSQGDVLEVLGMIKRNKDGEQHFTYPSGMFPPHIDEKWEHYADVVAQHVLAITRRNEGISNDVSMIAQLDAVRTAAHNNLSLAIKEFLQLENWDLEKCRQLVIKMRDAKFPNIETAEKEVTAVEVARLIATVRRLSKR